MSWRTIRQARIEDREFLRVAGQLSMVELLDLDDFLKARNKREEDWKREVVWRAVNRKRHGQEPWSPPEELKDPTDLIKPQAIAIPRKR